MICPICNNEVEHGIFHDGKNITAFCHEMQVQPNIFGWMYVEKVKTCSVPDGVKINYKKFVKEQVANG